jgi:hypothetical protein
MQQDIKVLLDGTFSNFNLAKQNINKALKKKRNI